jgi:hypothetical protein
VPQEIAVSDPSPALTRSVLETRFPHVAQTLATLWQDDPRAYLDSLTFDTRGGRQGFPPDAMSEILLLTELVWWRHHASLTEANDAVDDFHFAVSH